MGTPRRLDDGTRPAPPVHRPTLSLTVTAVTGRGHVAYLRRHLRAAHALLAPPLTELSLALVGDKRMGDLHDRFMGLPGPTDVLTFPLDADARGRVTAGEVVVCVPEARRRRAEHGVTLRQELLLYAVHGLLHLCGFDDKTDRQYRRMHRTEDDILAKLGVGPVFDARGPRAPASRRSRTPRAGPAPRPRDRG